MNIPSTHPITHSTSTRRRTIAATASTLALALCFALVPAAGSDAAIDPSSRASVNRAYTSVLLPALATKVGWNGSTSSCRTGAETAASSDATQDAVNFMRRLAGLNAVTFASSYSAKARKAALVYRAQGDLSHDIPRSWDCYSADAHYSGARSNIAIGVAGAPAISAYMLDPGSANTLAGHRRWILYPATRLMGTGSTTNTNALQVIGATSASYKDPAWVSWPTAGYFPAPLEPEGRWSLSGDSDHSYNFSKAKITVTSSSGTTLKVVTHAQQKSVIEGNDSVVFEVAGLKSPSGTAERRYTVRVTGILRGSKTVSHSYTVKLFNPKR